VKALQEKARRCRWLAHACQNNAINTRGTVRLQHAVENGILLNHEHTPSARREVLD
jgi:hypothetical protein